MQHYKQHLLQMLIKTNIDFLSRNIKNILENKICGHFNCSELSDYKWNELISFVFLHQQNEIKSFAYKIQNSNQKINVKNEKEINELFYLGSIPDPDLLIRTGGYQRLSNFIMHNLTYTELFFTDTLWPDFSEHEFNSIIDQYSKIDRKYGL